MLSTPEITHLEPQHAMAVHVTVAAAEIGNAMGQAFSEVFGYVAGQGAKAGMPFSLYRLPPGEMITFDAGAFVKVALPETERIKAITIPGGRVASAVHTGSYDSMVESYGQLTAWIEEASEAPGDVMWEVYLTDPDAEPDPSRWRTEIYWKLAEAVEGE